MKRFLCCLLLVLIWPKSAQSQIPGNATLVLFPGTPTGNCNSRQLGLDQSNGSLYTCVGAGNTNNGTWQVIAGGGGAGGWNPPSNTPGGTIFGNNGLSTGTASFFTPGGDVSFSSGNFSVNSLHFGSTYLPLGTPAPTAGQFLEFNGTSIVGGTPSGGGGTGLLGCTTPTSGNLVCDTSVQGGVGTVGMLTMPYSSGGLPTPPTGHEAAIAPDSGGNLFWSPGNSTAFAAIGTGGGQGPAGVASFNGRTGAVMPQASDYAAFFAPIGTGGGGAGTATALQFGSTTFVHSTTAPAPGECLMVTSDTVIGVNCGPLGGVTVID